MTVSVLSYNFIIKTNNSFDFMISKYQFLFLIPKLPETCSENPLLCQEFNYIFYFLLYRIKVFRSYAEILESFGVELVQEER